MWFLDFEVFLEVPFLYQLAPLFFACAAWQIGIRLRFWRTIAPFFLLFDF
jgi:hypothetical protein